MKIRFLPDCDCRCLNALTNIEDCEQDVIDIISTLNVDKAVGHDIISNRMLLAVKKLKSQTTVHVIQSIVTRIFFF
jgi:hypothetical protein